MTTQSTSASTTLGTTASTRITSRSTRLVCAVLATLTFAGCAGMTRQERNTAIGAGVGAAGAAVLGAGTLGTLGGAAIGGVVGHEINKPR